MYIFGQNDLRAWMLHAAFDRMLHNHVILCFIWNDYFLLAVSTSLHYLFYLCFTYHLSFNCLCLIGFIWYCHLTKSILIIFHYFLCWWIQTRIRCFRSFFRRCWGIATNSFRLDKSGENRLNFLQIIISFMCPEYDRWHWLEYNLALWWDEIDINDLIDTIFDIGDDDIDLSEKIREVANHLIFVFLHLINKIFSNPSN